MNYATTVARVMIDILITRPNLKKMNRHFIEDRLVGWCLALTRSFCYITY